MKNFDIKRFWYTLRWYFCENRSQLIAWSLGVIVGVVALESIFAVIGIKNSPFSNDIAYSMMVRSSYHFCVVCACIGIFYAYCNIFSSLKTKQKRISFLVLPATNLERYLSAFLMVFVVWPVFLFVALLIGDTLRMAVFGLFGNGWVSNISDWINFIIDKDTFKLSEMAEKSILLWLCSFAILGGTWLRKRPFLIVSTALILLFMAGTFIMIKVIGHTDHMSFHLSEHDTISYIVMACSIALTVFNFWLSYKIFNRFQIITSNWTNV